MADVKVAAHEFKRRLDILPSINLMEVPNQVESIRAAFNYVLEEMRDLEEGVVALGVPREEGSQRGNGA